METINSYVLIISASVIIIISYFFNLISKKTNIPSVLLLITLGLLIKGTLAITGFDNINWFPALEILGIIGLIMIVLESALDLKLSKDKTQLISKAFLIAFISIGVNIFVIAKIYQLFFIIDFFTAALYAIPISIISSAIVIPSIGTLPEEKKEFLIYESTFSDILGIIAFYSLLMFPEHDSLSSFTTTLSIGLALTLVLSFILSYLILFLAQKITTHIKLFLLIAILILFYAIGKLFHLSSLIIILIFGLIMNNRTVFIPGFIAKKLNGKALDNITQDIKLITLETSFVVRTFFFVIFGITLSLSAVANFKVIVITFLLLVTIYGSRYLILRLLNGKTAIWPEVFTAPRGLITILLFYAIPEEHAISDFNHGILFLLIIISSMLMTYALIKYKKTEQTRLPEKDNSANPSDNLTAPQ